MVCGAEGSQARGRLSAELVPLEVCEEKFVLGLVLASAGLLASSVCQALKGHRGVPLPACTPVSRAALSLGGPLGLGAHPALDDLSLAISKQA